MRSLFEQLREVVFQACLSDAAYSPAEASFIAAETLRAVERVQSLVVDFKHWSGGEPPCDFDQINTYVTAALPSGVFSETDARRLLREWGKAEGNFR